MRIIAIGQLGLHIVLFLLAGLASSLASGKDGPGLTINGEVNDSVRDNIRKLVDIRRYDCQPRQAQYGLLRRQIHTDATTAMQALGYYQNTLSLTLSTDDECIRAILDITAGPPVLLEHVNIQIQGEAAADPAFTRRVNAARLVPGQRLRHDRYSNLKKDLQQLMINRGYIEGKLQRHRVEVDTRRNRANIILHLQSGPRYHFGEARLSDTNLSPKLVRSYLHFAPGEPFDNAKLLETQQAYLGTNYFSAVRIERGKPDRKTKRIPIRIVLTARPRWSVLTGVGVSTDTGPRVRLGLENRRINRAGHRARVETEISEIRQGAGATYQIPLKDPLKERLDLRTSFTKENTDSADTEKLTIGADYIVELENRWVATTSLDYLREVFQVADEVGQVELIMPGFQLHRVKSDDPIYPRFGWRLTGKVQFAHQALASTSSFTRFSGNGKLILPAGKGRLISRINAGYTEVSNVDQLPASLRFFAGGDSSVRGFAYQSLGPKDDEGEVEGGRHLLTGSLEYDYPIFDRWSLALFTDLGNAFNEFGNYELRRSAGAGVRWRSPLGPIRLDLARAVDESRGLRLHLSMGPDL